MLFKGAFFQLEVQIVLFQLLEDSVDIFSMFCNVVVGVNQDIIHIDGYPSFSYFVLEDVVYHCLECCRGVGKSEEHYFWLEQSLVGSESCFPFIPFFDLDVVIPPSYVEL